MPEEKLIQVRGLNKTFHLGKMVVRALNDVDLDIYRGEYLSIMGPSGSGKSTLFNMVGALDRPTSGEVRVADVDLTKLSRRQLAYFRGNHIGYVFQSYNLIAAYSATGNVAMPLIFCGMDHARAVERACEVLDRVGLGHRRDHRPDELSGGQQQRVAIARALANSPAIILADEPTANLDLKTGQDVLDILVKINKERGVTVVCSTHDHRLLSLCDRIMWVRDGTIERVEEAKDIKITVGKIGGEEE